MTDNDRHNGSSSDCDREAVETAEREAVIKKAEVLAWAYERQAALRQAEHEASLPKSEPAPVSSRRTAPADNSRDFATKKYVQDGFGAAADKLSKFISDLELRIYNTTREARETALAPLRAEIAELRDQVATLTRELAELKTRDIDRRLRAVPSSPTALIA